MTDLVITAASVVKGASADVDHGTAGATITAGQAVYLDTATRKYLLADSDSATAAAKLPSGVALNGAANNQPVAVQKSGDVTIGATLTPGTDYWLSNTPGGICPRADVGAGESAVFMGVAKSASVLSLDIKSSGVTL